MKIKVSEATNIQLDWLAATIEGLTPHHNAHLAGSFMEGWWFSGYYIDPNIWIPLFRLGYSTDWAQGGPIIEREGVSLKKNQESLIAKAHLWVGISDELLMMSGPTPLIAAMRCFVASKLGDEVEVPEELA